MITKIHISKLLLFAVVLLATTFMVTFASENKFDITQVAGEYYAVDENCPAKTGSYQENLNFIVVDKEDSGYVLYGFDSCYWGTFNRRLMQYPNERPSYYLASIVLTDKDVDSGFQYLTTNDGGTKEYQRRIIKYSGNKVSSTSVFESRRKFITWHFSKVTKTLQALEDDYSRLLITVDSIKKGKLYKKTQRSTSCEYRRK